MRKLAGKKARMRASGKSAEVPSLSRDGDGKAEEINEIPEPKPEAEDK